MFNQWIISNIYIAAQTVFQYYWHCILSVVTQIIIILILNILYIMYICIHTHTHIPEFLRNLAYSTNGKHDVNRLIESVISVKSASKFISSFCLVLCQITLNSTYLIFYEHSLVLFMLNRWYYCHVKQTGIGSGIENTTLGLYKLYKLVLWLKSSSLQMTPLFGKTYLKKIKNKNYGSKKLLQGYSFLLPLVLFGEIAEAQHPWDSWGFIFKSLSEIRSIKKHNQCIAKKRRVCLKVWITRLKKNSVVISIYSLVSHVFWHAQINEYTISIQVNVMCIKERHC